MDKSIAVNVLYILCEMYINKYGDSLAYLKEWKFDITTFLENKKLMKINEKYESEFGGETHEWFESLFSELEERSFIKRASTSAYVLTAEGYEYGKSSYFSKFIRFLNSNPGISLLISALSLVVALAALVVSYKNG